MAKSKKKYSEWTAEEKAAYKAKREAYWKNREEEEVAAYQALEKELVALKAKPEVMALLAKLKHTKVNRESVSYLQAIFGTDTPAEGQVATFLYIGVRGLKGERLNDGETMGQFITRCGDCTYKYDANTIASMVWYLKRKGHMVVMDRKKAIVTYVEYKEPVPEVAEKPKAELIKKSTKAA